MLSIVLLDVKQNVPYFFDTIKSVKNLPILFSELTEYFVNFVNFFRMESRLAGRLIIKEGRPLRFRPVVGDTGLEPVTSRM